MFGGCQGFGFKDAGFGSGGHGMSICGNVGMLGCGDGGTGRSRT